MTKKLYCVSSEKIQSREALLWWLKGFYWAMGNKLGIDINTSNLTRRSRESLWKLYKKIKGAV